jgi:hypothetical protein
VSPITTTPDGVRSACTLPGGPADDSILRWPLPARSLCACTGAAGGPPARRRLALLCYRRRRPPRPGGGPTFLSKLPLSIVPGRAPPRPRAPCPLPHGPEACPSPCSSASGPRVLLSYCSRTCAAASTPACGLPACLPLCLCLPQRLPASASACSALLACLPAASLLACLPALPLPACPVGSVGAPNNERGAQRVALAAWRRVRE